MLRCATILAVILSLAAPALRADVLVFAAASLKEPLDRMAARFDGVVVSYGGSGTLARQVSLGAPADIVLLANDVWMETLIDGEHVVVQTVADFASNALVLIGVDGMKPLPLESEALDIALGDGRIAIGLTKAVPAGIYARAALQSLGLWEAFQHRLAEVDNVRSALGLVIRGQTPLGIVYATDARISDAVVAVAIFPKESHPPIRYTGALTDDGNPEARAFLTYIAGPEGQAILAEAGFLPPVVIAP